MALEAEAAAQAGELGPVDEDVDAVGEHVRRQGAGEFAAAEAVHQHLHRHPAPRRPGQGGGHGQAHVVVGEDVGFEEDFVACRVDGGNQRGEVFHPAFEELQPVVGLKLGRHRGYPWGRRRAASKAWSEMRDQGRPEWTWASATTKPRT